MGEAKQRAKTANDPKIIEASEQERIACVLFFAGISPDNRQELRRYERLFSDFDLDAADEARIARLKQAKETGEDGVALSAWSSQKAEYTTTKDVIEYFLKATDAKIPGPVGRHILPLAERMLALEEGSYTAPSQKVVELTAEPAAPPV